MYEDQDGNLWVIAVFNENGIQQIGGIPQECLSGEVFWDANSDGQRSGQEPGLSAQKALLQPDSTVFFSSTAGKYKFDVNAGEQYKVDLFFETDDWELTSDSASYSVLAEEGCVEGLDFGFQSLVDTELGRINFVAGFPRCFAEVPFWVNVENRSFIPLSGGVEIILDSLISFVGA